MERVCRAPVNVAYDLDLGKLEAACAEFYKAFSVHDAELYEERYNLLNAYLATVPGNSAFKQIALIDDEIRRTQAILNQKISSFLLQVDDFLHVNLLDKQDAFRVLKEILNFAPQKLDLSKLKHDTFLDFYLCESHLECHRGFLRLDDYYVKVLTLKEPSAQSFPLLFQTLLEVEANFFVATEWKREDTSKTRGRIHSRRRHFHNTKRSLISHLNTSDAPAAAQDVLVDDSKEAQILFQIPQIRRLLDLVGHLLRFLNHYLTERRKEIDRKYDYRYSQLTHVFGRLLYERRITEEDLRGLGEDKMKPIRSLAELLAKYAA